MTKLKNTNCYKTKTSNHDNTNKLYWDQSQIAKNSKTQTVTKSKISNCDKTQKHKLQQNSITEIATKLKT